MKTLVSALFAFLTIQLATEAGAQQSLRKFELQANSPEFWNLIARDAKLDQVAGGFGFTEGPVWDSAGFLYVSDETLNKIFRVYVSDGRKEEVIALGDPDSNTYDRHGRLIDCASILRAINFCGFSSLGNGFT